MESYNVDQGPSLGHAECDYRLGHMQQQLRRSIALTPGGRTDGVCRMHFRGAPRLGDLPCDIELKTPRASAENDQRQVCPNVSS